MRCQKDSSSNLHNHKIHSSFRIAQCVKEKICTAVANNPALTPTEIAIGKGIGFIPSAMDEASSHSGKIAHEVARTKLKQGLKDRNWLPMNFEEVADKIDDEDNQFCDDGQASLAEYKKHGRPYLVASGYEDEIKFVFTMSPVMIDVIAEAEFIQCDITYENCKDYPYIFNAVAFNKVTMEWMVVARLRMSKQNAVAYSLAFKRIFAKASTNADFEPGSTLLGVITDWSDAEINGLRLAVGKSMAEKLLKGCSVHWQRLCQRIAERVASSSEKTKEKDIIISKNCL